MDKAEHLLDGINNKNGQNKKKDETKATVEEIRKRIFALGNLT